VLRILDDLGDTRNEWFEAIDLDTGYTPQGLNVHPGMQEHPFS
jgi:hypothetical protein